MFEREKQALITVFGEKALNIEHIGSTSVPGLSSKPIIDIAVLIDHVDDADMFVEKLEELGYVIDTRALSTERHFFRKYEDRNFHLSIAYRNQGGFWSRQILFRDYLRNHPELRDEYDDLKKKLLEKDPRNRQKFL